MKNLIHNENEFFEHFNFQIKNHIDDRRDLTSRMREYAGMDLAPLVAIDDSVRPIAELWDPRTHIKKTRTKNFIRDRSVDL